MLSFLNESTYVDFFLVICFSPTQQRRLTKSTKRKRYISATTADHSALTRELSRTYSCHRNLPPIINVYVPAEEDGAGKADEVKCLTPRGKFAPETEISQAPDRLQTSETRPVTVNMERDNYQLMTIYSYMEKVDSLINSKRYPFHPPLST